MGPIRHIPSNFGDHRDQVYLVPFSFCNWLSFYLLTKFKGEIKKSREGNLWNMRVAVTGDREEMEEEKEGD